MRKRIIVIVSIFIILIMMIFFVFNTPLFQIDGSIISMTEDNKLSEIKLATGEICDIYESFQHSNLCNPDMYKDKIIMCGINNLSGEWEIIEFDYSTKKIEICYRTPNKIANPIRIDDNNIVFLMSENDLWFLYVVNESSNNFAHKVLSDSVLNSKPARTPNRTFLISVDNNKNGLICEVNLTGEIKIICEGDNAIWVDSYNGILYNFQHKVFSLNTVTHETELIIDDTAFFATPTLVDDKVFFVDFDEVGLFSGATAEYCFVLDINKKQKVKLVDLFSENDIEMSTRHYNIGVLGLTSMTEKTYQ